MDRDTLTQNHCYCGSQHSYRQCCGLHPSTVIAKTLTDECVQPMRLYYTTENDSLVISLLTKLDCVTYDSDRDAWIIEYAHEAADFDLPLASDALPKAIKPLVIAEMTFVNDEDFMIDVYSIERAINTVKFISQHLPVAVGELMQVAIYNRVFTWDTDVPQKWETLVHADLFAENRLRFTDPYPLVNLLRRQLCTNTLVDSQLLEAAKKPLPLVECFSAESTQTGIAQLQMQCWFREIIAMERATGQPDFSLLDVLWGVTQQQRNSHCLHKM